MSLITPNIAPQFERAGWFEDRRVAVDPTIPRQHPSYGVLYELGGIVLLNPATGVRSLAFRHVCDGASLVAPWEAALASKMVGIADQDDGHAELYVTARGQVIGCSLVHPAFWFVGGSFEDAIEALVRGERSKPMLLPNESETMLYGTRFGQGGSEVLRPADLA